MLAGPPFESYQALASWIALSHSGMNHPIRQLSVNGLGTGSGDFTVFRVFEYANTSLPIEGNFGIGLSACASRAQILIMCDMA